MRRGARAPRRALRGAATRHRTVASRRAACRASVWGAEAVAQEEEVGGAEAVAPEEAAREVQLSNGLGFCVC